MIGIVGGGLAGLAAAYRLQQAGREVCVYEGNDRLGGLAATYETRGDRIEKFYHHLSKSERTIVELAEELGVGDRVEWRIGKNAYYVDGVVHPLDAPWEIAAYPYLSTYDKFRLTMLTLGIDVRGGVPRRDTYERLEDFEDVPIREFLLEHTTAGVYEHFFEPLLDAKFGDRKEDVSAAWLLGRIQFRGERDLLRGEILGYLEGGFGVLVDALVDAVGRENIETGTFVTDASFAQDVGARPAVRRVDSGDVVGADPGGVGADGQAAGVDREARGVADDRAGDGGVETAREPAAARAASPGRGPIESVTVERDAGGGDRVVETRDVDDLVVATMPDVLEVLTGYECAIEFQASIVAVVSMSEQLLDTYWLNVADEAPFGALIEHTNFVPPERYGGEHLLYVATYVQDLGDELWQLDDEEIQEQWLEGIADLFPQFDREAVNWCLVGRNPTTAPIYERGYLDMVVPYDLADEGTPGVYYAGMATRAQYPERSLDGAIEAGFAAADHLLEE